MKENGLMQKITAKQLDRLIKESVPKRTALGDGLYLTITQSGSVSFGFRYKYNKKSYLQGLGSFCAVNNTLAIARNKSIKLKALLGEGINPLHHKKQQRINEQHKLKEDQLIERKKKAIFKVLALEYIETRQAEWKNKKHRQQWENTLSTYAFPVIGEMPVNDIETEHILKILKPIWSVKTETATRLRTRLESVLSYAEAHQLREKANPARWRGHLSVILPSPGKIKKLMHHSALPYSELPEFLQLLTSSSAISARALEFTILTAARTNEVIGAKWSEFDIDKLIWTVPKERMKMGKTHRIPLSDPAITLVNKLRQQNKYSEYVFTNPVNTKHISNGAMSSVLKRLGRSDITVHGFRSTFRDFVAEKTKVSSRTAEAALAHKLRDSVEEAYQRSDLLEKRRHLMDIWASFCYPPESNILNFQKRQTLS